MWNYINKILIAPVIILSFLLNPFQALAITLTLGQTTDSTSTTSSSGDASRVSQAISTMGGVITGGHARIWLDSAGSSQTRLVLYSDSAGDPANLLAYSDIVTITQTSEALVDYIFSSENQIYIAPNTPYWVGFIAEDPGAINYVWSRGSTGATARRTSAGDTFSDGPNLVFNETSAGTGIIDVYLDFTEGFGQTHTLLNSSLYKSGLAYTFDGVDERAYVDNPTGFTSDNTGSIGIELTFSDLTLTNGSFINISGMAGVNATPGGQFQIGVRRDDTLAPTNKRRISVLNFDGTTGREVIGSTDLAINTPYHIVVQSNGSAYSVYINGSLETLTVRLVANTGLWFSDFSFSGTPRFAIGNTYRQASWAPLHITGAIGGYFITSDTLTQTQVTNLYNSGKPVHPCLLITCSNIHSFWRLGESDNGSVTTTFDSLGTNNLTPENMENADITSTNYY